jgi:hypothetical protein
MTATITMYRRIGVQDNCDVAGVILQSKRVMILEDGGETAAKSCRVSKTTSCDCRTTKRPFRVLGERSRSCEKKPGFTRAEPDLVTDIHEGKRSVLFLLEYSLYRRAKEQTICPFDREHAHE